MTVARFGFLDKGTVYSVQGGDWLLYYAEDIKKWIQIKG